MLSAHSCLHPRQYCGVDQLAQCKRQDRCEDDPWDKPEHGCKLVLQRPTGCGLEANRYPQYRGHEYVCQQSHINDATSSAKTVNLGEHIADDVTDREHHDPCSKYRRAQNKKFLRSNVGYENGGYKY